MKIYNKEELNNSEYSLTYDDISLIPVNISDVKSRSEIQIKCEFLGKNLSIPVLSSPMDAVTGIDMCKELNDMGAIGVLNRFNTSLPELVSSTNNELDFLKAVSIGIDTDEKLISTLAEMNMIICIDTANANNKHVLSLCEKIKKKYNSNIIIGNIACGLTLSTLSDAGADAVRVGIGSGSVCTTSIQTGIGIGQVSSILSVYFERKEKNLNIKIIADGGIKSPGDIAKAIALGSDVVMLGRMLAGTKETPGEIIKYNDQLWKKYRGSASFGVKMKNEFIEGEETMVPYKGTVRNVINAISDGLKSSMSYMNCHTIEELRDTKSFAKLSNSSYLERLPRK